MWLLSAVVIAVLFWNRVRQQQQQQLQQKEQQQAVTVISGISIFEYPRITLNPLNIKYLLHHKFIMQRVLFGGPENKLAQLLVRRVGSYVNPPYYNRAFNKMRCSITRRVASNMLRTVRYEVAQQAEQLCASGQCAAAIVPLQFAINLSHLPSRSLMAWLLIDGREGVVRDYRTAFKLVEEGARLGCHHCQGVMAECYLYGYGIRQDAARSLELARESSGKGSRYGQYVLGYLYQHGVGGVTQDDAQAVALYRLAAAQNLDEAQDCLGNRYYIGIDVAEDFTETLRWFQLAAAQGHPSALYMVAFCHEFGQGVPKNKAEAIRWYRRAQAAGCQSAATKLQRLRA